MAIYGLQIEYMNKILKQYFGLNNPEYIDKELFLGLGLTQHGAMINLPDFSEVFGGRPLGNYRRARIIFSCAEDGRLHNINEIVFNTAQEDWTESNEKIEMVGIFDTIEYENTETKEIVKPIAVFRLARFESVLKGETVIFEPGTIELSLSDL